ncbi:ser Thr phosphatase [Cordyceps militaris]|uniref:Ser Thr phosphatase n=1 Tax=Cordyceps militaris TaxID=73501 RepID=A0A2H4SRI8_CORMI|nr:ser Thr phosphatase [Cordyceps militaris]
MTPIEVVNRVLGGCGIAVCSVGELVLNYYNVPRAIYELEFCVSRGYLVLAAAKLCLSGNFEPCDPEPTINNYTEYKRGFPRLRTTFLPDRQQTIIIFTAHVYGLEPLAEKTLTIRAPDCHVSKEMDGFNAEEMAAMTLPRLAPYLRGQAAKFLSTRDDVAMIAVEELIDGMDLDEGWVSDQLQDFAVIPRAVNAMVPYAGSLTRSHQPDRRRAAPMSALSLTRPVIYGMVFGQGMTDCQSALQLI